MFCWQQLCVVIIIYCWHRFPELLIVNYLSQRPNIARLLPWSLLGNVISISNHCATVVLNLILGFVKTLLKLNMFWHVSSSAAVC